MKLMTILAESLGLRCVNEKEGVFHLPVQPGGNDEFTLNKMSKLEENGFHFQGIENRIGGEPVMVFSVNTDN